jgi:recombination protein RecA
MAFPKKGTTTKAALATKAAAKTTEKKAAAASAATTTTKGNNAEVMKFLQEYDKKGMIGDIGQPISFISSGSWVVDRIIGDGTGTGAPGGIPRGFMTEVFGQESCGKTTLALHACAEAQKKGGLVVYVDFEKSLEAQWHYIKNLGINLDKTKFVHLRPDTYEEGIKAMFEATVRLKPAVLVVDSLAAAIPAKFLTGNVDEAAQIGLHAKTTGIFISTMNKVILKCNTALIIINQLRTNIKGKYDEGPQEQTTGGKAQKYYMHLRIQMKPKAKEAISEISAITGMKEDKLVNQQVIVTAVKNKLDKPFRSAPIYITFGKGFDGVRSLISLAEARGVIQKGGGGYYSYKSPTNEALNFNLQGKDALSRHLEEHDEILQDMKPRLFPQVDAAAYVEAKAHGVLDGDEELDPEMQKLMETMSSQLEGLNAPAEEEPQEY